MRALVFLILLGQMAGSTELRITFVDRAGLSRKERADLCAGAARIFAKAGIETTWLEGAPYPAERNLVAAAEPVMMDARRTKGCLRTEIAFEFIAHAPEGPKASALGMALPFTCMGANVRLFRDRIEQAAGRQNVSRFAVAAHVLAHEIGHVLLGHDTHARHGLMSSNWSEQEYARMRMGSLLFTLDEALILRTALHSK